MANKDLKNDSVPKALEGILSDIPEAIESQETGSEEKDPKDVDLVKNDSVSKDESGKRWVITLVESRSYSHPKVKKPFLKGKPFTTCDQTLAEDCQANSYFNVQEI